MLDEVFLSICHIPCVGSRIRNYIVKKQGGETRSHLIRKYYSKRKVEVGMYSYGGCFSESFNSGGSVEVGRYCSIASHVSYFGANHPTEYLSQSAFFYNKTFGFNVQDIERKHLIIGNDVWIGYGAIITAGCSIIGNGAVIGAGSVVTHDVPAYAIVGGNPARIIKMRFEDETIKQIEESKWWEKEPKELFEYYQYIADPIQMIIKMRSNNEKQKFTEKKHNEGVFG